MAGSVEHISEQLFKIIKGNGHAVTLFTDEGKKTVEPAEARLFYAKDIQMMVNFIVDENTNEIVVNLSAGTDIESIRPMLDSIRKLASRYLVEYTVKTFGKTVEPKDFAYQAMAKVNEGYVIINRKTGKPSGWHPNPHKTMAAAKRRLNAKGRYSYGPNPEQEWEIKQMKNETVQEGFSGWKGTARKSIQELGDARIIVRHKRDINEEKPGARSRQIESIFIENAEGERFKFPTRNLTAARAMLKHVNEGGVPHDDFGQYIYETMEELGQLKSFQRYNRNRNFFESEDIVEEIAGRIDSLRGRLKSMATVNGYQQHFESFTLEQEEVSQERLDELKDTVTVRYFDEAISDSLPYVARVIEGFRTRQEKEAEIVNFARYVMQHKDDLQTNKPIDFDDPEAPTNRKFRDDGAKVSAMVSFMAPHMKDDMLANMMMQISDTVFEVGPKHVNLALQALNVIKQQAGVAEQAHPEKVAEDEAQIARINETFDKYNVREIFDI